jgi:hypothetical protein
MSHEERLQVLREAVPNRWIELSEDESRVVATGGTYAEAVEQAEREGVADPLLIKTPDDWLRPVF